MFYRTSFVSGMYKLLAHILAFEWKQMRIRKWDRLIGWRGFFVRGLIQQQQQQQQQPYHSQDIYLFDQGKKNKTHGIFLWLVVITISQNKFSRSLSSSSPFPRIFFFIIHVFSFVYRCIKRFFSSFLFILKAFITESLERLCRCPTKLFTNQELQKPSIGKFY